MFAILLEGFFIEIPDEIHHFAMLVRGVKGHHNSLQNVREQIGVSYFYRCRDFQPRPRLRLNFQPQGAIKVSHLNKRWSAYRSSMMHGSRLYGNRAGDLRRTVRQRGIVKRYLDKERPPWATFCLPWFRSFVKKRESEHWVLASKCRFVVSKNSLEPKNTTSTVLKGRNVTKV